MGIPISFIYVQPGYIMCMSGKKTECRYVRRDRSKKKNNEQLDRWVEHAPSISCSPLASLTLGVLFTKVIETQATGTTPETSTNLVDGFSRLELNILPTAFVVVEELKRRIVV